MTYCEFTYYKETGKYYSEGSHFFEKDLAFHKAARLTTQMLNNGIRPGLNDGKEFHTVVTITTKNGPMSYLYIRKDN